MLKRYFGFTFFLYLLAAVLLSLVVDPRLTQLKRLNALVEYSTYPLSLNWSDKEVSTTKLYRALTYYKIMADIYPKLAQGYELAGDCYFFIKDYHRSQQWLAKADKVQPGRIWVEYNLGVAAYKVGDSPKATRYFQEITDGNFQAQLIGTVLSNLSKLPLEKRNELFVLLPYFVKEIREKSLRMTVQSDIHLFFHPWGYIISPGQEVMY